MHVQFQMAVKVDGTRYADGQVVAAESLPAGTLPALLRLRQAVTCQAPDAASRRPRVPVPPGAQEETQGDEQASSEASAPLEQPAAESPPDQPQRKRRGK